MATVQAAYGTRANWLSTNRTPVLGEVCIETDTGRLKFGDGATAYQNLVYLSNLTIPAYAAGASPASFYDGSRGVYNGKGAALRIVDQGRSDAMTNGMSRHLVIGDSVSAGCTSGIGVATYDRLRAWPMSMRDQFAVMGIPANGTGFVRINDSQQFEERWVRTAPTGTWVATSNIYSVATANASTVTFWPDRPGSILEIGARDDGGATVAVVCDGVALGNIVTGGGASGTAGMKKFKFLVPGGVKSTSKVVLTVTTAGTGFALGGGGTWTPNGGIIIDNVAQSGSYASASSAVGNSKTWDNGTLLDSPIGAYKDVSGRKRQVATASSTATSTTLTATGANFSQADVGEAIDQFPTTSGIMFPPNTYIVSVTDSTHVVVNQAALQTLSSQTINIGRDPHCVHIALGGNDTILGTATQAQVKTSITAIAALFPNSDIILHLENEASPTLATAGEELAQQVMMFQLADAIDKMLYDWRDRAGNYSTAFNNGIMQDYQAHMIPGMYADLGSSLAQYFGGGSGHPQSYSNAVFEGDLVNYRQFLEATRGIAVGNISVLTTVETVVMQIKVPANTMRANASTFKFSMFMHPAATTITTTRVRIGPLGTTSDPAVQITSATAATNAASRYSEGCGTVNAIGASATFIAGGTETVGAISAAGASTAATSSFDSTKDNWITVTVQNTSSTTTTVYSGVLEVRV